MSRIGRKPIRIPSGISVEVKDSVVTVSKGGEKLQQEIDPRFTIRQEGEELLLERPNDNKDSRALHGLYRSLINNMVEGLDKGFSKNLEITGVGFRAAKQGNKLVMNLGYSHPVEMEEPKGITIDVPAPTKITVKGADKQLVGEVAAKIRSKRVPDVYKNKGIRYEGEVLRKKEGKTGAKAK